MAKHKLQQILLVSADGTTQPPFPGGWVLAVFEAVHAFAPACAAKHQLPGSRRTHDRLKAGEPVKQATYNEIESRLVVLATALFPTVAVINNFAGKYVGEYFRLWRQAAEYAPHLVTAYGFQPGQPGVLARMLLRDLVLRLCYLESCERALNGEPFTEQELDVLRHDIPERVYAGLIAERARRENLSMQKLAANMGLYVEKLRRLKRGVVEPNFQLLLKLSPAGANQRLLAGIGFLDVFLRKLGLNEGVMWPDILRVSEILLPAHRRALDIRCAARRDDSIPGSQNAGTDLFAQFAAYSDNLLLHPGFETVWPKMPDAL